MKRIFASLLAVIMLVSCFAVSTSAADITNAITTTDIVEGGTFTMTWKVNYTADITEEIESAMLFKYNYNADEIKPIKETAAINDTNCTMLVKDSGSHIELDIFELTLNEAGKDVEIIVTIDFEVLAAAGSTITLTEIDNESNFLSDNGEWYFAENGYETIVWNVGSNGPTLTAVASGTQVRTSPEMADVRIKFDLDKTAADFANFESGVINVTINNGTESKTVAVPCVNTFANTDATVTYTVVITGIPAAAWGWTISADFVATFSNGTTTGSAAATSVTTLVDAAA